MALFTDKLKSFVEKLASAMASLAPSVSSVLMKQLRGKMEK